MRYLILTLLLLNLVGCSETPYTNLDNSQLKALLSEGIPIYDIRRAEEWSQTGVIDGSHRLTFVDRSGRLMPDFLPRFTSEVNKDSPVILICRTGNRTKALASHLAKELGYSKVYNVKNGITDWLRDGNPVVRR